MKTVLYHNIVAPYRHALFEELAKVADLEVWYSTLITRDRNWSTVIPPTYRHRVLRSHVAYALGRPLIYCPDLIGDLERERPNAVVAVLTRSNAGDVIRICRFGRRSGVPVVLWVGAIEKDSALHDGVPVTIERLFERYHRFALKRADAFIYYSEHSRIWAERRGARGPFAIGTQVLEGTPLQPRVELPDPAREVIGLFVGKLEHRKGFDLLVDCVSRLEPALRSSFRLRVAGDGPLADRTAPLCSIPINVDLLGNLSRDHLWSEYRNADFVVLPSRHDPWGFVINEAMSMGTPALVSEQCGGAQLARTAGWTFDASCPDTFDSALRAAISQCRSPSRRMLAISAEREYRPQAAAERIAKLLHSLRPLNPGNGPRAT